MLKQLLNKETIKINMIIKRPLFVTCDTDLSAVRFEWSAALPIRI